MCLSHDGYNSPRVAIGKKAAAVCFLGAENSKEGRGLSRCEWLPSPLCLRGILWTVLAQDHVKRCKRAVYCPSGRDKRGRMTSTGWAVDGQSLPDHIMLRLQPAQVLFLVPSLSPMFDTMTGRCFNSRAWWLKKKIQDFCQTAYTQEVCLHISFHLPGPRSLFVHPHCSSQHSPADEMPTRDVSPLSLSHWEHTAALGLSDGFQGKSSATATPFTVCSLPIQSGLNQQQCLRLPN